MASDPISWGNDTADREAKQASLQSPAQQLIVISNVKPLHLPEENTRLDISYMFQEHRLLPWLTALENVIAPVDDDKRQKALMMLEALGLGADIDKMPDELSGGMKQRVSLARALLYGKSVLILDEPFAALDEAIKKRSAELVRSETVDKTVILVSHNSNDYKLVFDNYRILTVK